MNFPSHIIKSLGACALAAFSGMAGAQSVDILAGFDFESPTFVANSFFTVVNHTSSDLTQVVFTAVGDGSSGTSEVATWQWIGANSTIAAGQNLTAYFTSDATEVSGTGLGFTPDYEFTIAGNDQTYSFSALLNGQTITATFSPATNASGTFVAFLGNNSDGDPAAASVIGTMASIAVSAVPEPQSWALMLAGLVGLGWRSKARTLQRQT
jgi:hypothetical protein